MTAATFKLAPYGYVLEQPDGHATLFKKDPTSFRTNGYPELGFVVRDLFDGAAPEQPNALGYVPSDDIFMPFMVLVENYMDAVDYHGGQKGERCEAAEAAIRAALVKLAAPVATPAPSAPVLWWREGGTDALHNICFEGPKGRHWIPLFRAAPAPSEWTEAQVSAAGRALADRSAAECRVDKEDNWKVYGSTFIEDARAVLDAAAGVPV